jgi:hypothetical protein
MYCYYIEKVKHFSKILQNFSIFFTYFPSIYNMHLGRATTEQGGRPQWNGGLRPPPCGCGAGRRKGRARPWRGRSMRPSTAMAVADKGRGAGRQLHGPPRARSRKMVRVRVPVDPIILRATPKPL